MFICILLHQEKICSFLFLFKNALFFMISNIIFYVSFTSGVLKP